MQRRANTLTVFSSRGSTAVVRQRRMAFGGDGDLNVEAAKFENALLDEAQLTPVASRQRARLAAYFSFLLVDGLSILLGFTVAEQFRSEQYLVLAGVDLGLTTVLVYVLIAANQSAYNLDILESYLENVRRALTALALAAMIIAMVTFATKSGLMISRVAFASAIITSGVGIAVSRWICHRMYFQQLRGRLTDNLFIQDGGDPPPKGHGCLILDARTIGMTPDLSDPAMLSRVSRLLAPFDRVIISCPARRQAAWSVVLKGSSVSGEFMLQGISDWGPWV